MTDPKKPDPKPLPEATRALLERAAKKLREGLTSEKGKTHDHADD